MDEEFGWGCGGVETGGVVRPYGREMSLDGCVCGGALMAIIGWVWLMMKAGIVWRTTVNTALHGRRYWGAASTFHPETGRQE